MDSVKLVEILKGVSSRVINGQYGTSVEFNCIDDYVFHYYINTPYHDGSIKRVILFKDLEEYQISNLLEQQLKSVLIDIKENFKKEPVKPDNTLKIISADEVRKRMESNRSDLLNDLLNEFNKTVEYYLDNMQGKNKPFKIYLTAKQRNHIPFRKVLEGLGYVLTDINDKDDLDTIVSLGFEDGSDKFGN